MPLRPVAVLVSLALAALPGCGRTDLFEAPAVEVQLDPTTATVGLRRSLRFTALTTPPGEVTWSVETPAGGTIDAEGLYTAPAAFPEPAATSLDVVVRATSVDAPEAFAEAAVTVVVPDAGEPADLVRVSGDGQNGVAGELLRVALVVRVLDADGAPIPDVAVRFVSPFAEADSLVRTTDADGLASASPRAGRAAGRQSFDVAVEGLAPVVFTATIGPAEAETLEAAHPAPRGPAGGTLAEPLVVTLLDGFGNPLPDETVAPVPPAGGAATPLAARTDATGRLSFTIALAPTPGPQTFSFLHGRSGRGASVVFSALGGPAATAAIVSGDGQAVPVNTAAPDALVVQVLDAGGFASAGAAVAWRALDGGSFSRADAASDDFGFASAVPVVGTRAGLARFEASVAGAANGPLTFVLRGTPGAAQRLLFVSGDGQSATAGQPFGAAFSVRATDAFSNGVADVPVRFETLAGGGTATPAEVTSGPNGLAQADLVAGGAGVQRYRASAAGLVGSPIDLLLTAVTAGNVSLEVVSGASQSAEAGSALAEPLIVRVVRGGLPAAGQTVTFGVALGGGSVRPATSVSASDGIARTTAYLGPEVGAQRFSAAVTGAATGPVFFDATALPRGPALLRAVSGDGQSAAPGDTLAGPLVVEALDGAGQPVPGASVTFAATSGDGSVAPAVATTGADGRAATVATVGAAEGPNTFSATTGALPPAVFHAEARLGGGGTPRLRIVSGGGQAAEVGFPLSSPFVVRLTDAANRPVAGVEVRFRPEAELASVSPIAAVTDAAGEARTVATLGKPLGTQLFYAEADDYDGSPAAFAATATAAPAARLLIASGDGQHGRVGAALARPFVARVTDRVGNGMAGITVTFAPGPTGGAVAPATGVSDAQGLVSATATLGTTIGPQTWTATAALETSPATATFTATATNEVERLSLTPQGTQVEVGASPRFVATAIFTDGSTAIVTEEATWSSLDPAAMTVSDAPGSRGVGRALAAGTTSIRARYGGRTGETTARVVNATLRSIVILPAVPTLVRGSARPFVANGTFSNNAVADVTESATWTSGAPAVASVSDTAGTKGFVRGTGVGVATLTATLAGVTATRLVTVTQAPLTQLEVTPVNVVQPAGTSADFRATATYADGTVQDVTTVAAWSSSDPALMTLQNAPAQAGRATFLAAGTPEVVATLQGTTARRRVTISQATVVRLAALPDELQLAVRDFFQLRLIATWTDGTIGDAAALATWSSSNPAVADVSNAAPNRGTITGIGTGSATITGRIGAATATVEVEITSATVRNMLVVSGPGGGRVRCAAGTLLRLRALAEYSDGGTAEISDQASWSSSDPTIAVVHQGAQNGGIVQCLATGQVTVTASWAGRSATADVTVTAATLVRLELSPAGATFAVGDVRPFFANGVYSDGRNVDVTFLVTWASTDGAVLAVSNAPGSRGRATGLAPGPAEVVASLGGVSARAAVTVSGARLVAIIIGPANQNVRVRERFFQFNATAFYDDNSTQDVTALSAWAAGNPAVATASNDPETIGAVLLTGTGETTVTASYGGETGATTLTVRP